MNPKGEPLKENRTSAFEESVSEDSWSRGYSELTAVQLIDMRKECTA
jgi:hypothetical protein